MAGERIFMRTDLETDSRVKRIAHELNITDLHVVIGKLWALWALADGHTEDGRLPYMLPEILDEHLRCPGISSALVKVGWLEIVDDAVIIPRFTEYNGKSAKRRLRNAQRMFERRSDDARPAHGKRTPGTHGAHKKDTSGTPASASASEKDTTLAGFAEFWAACPRKEGKGAAEREWRSHELGSNRALRAVVMAGLERVAPHWRARIAAGFTSKVPHPSTWLHQRRWEDEPESNHGADSNGFVY